jgi:hypothetical protein
MELLHILSKLNYGGKKAVKIGAQVQDEADLSQVGSYECPQVEEVEAKRILVSFHKRDNHTSDHRENKQQINMAVHLQSSFPSLVKIVKYDIHVARYVCVQCL